MKGLYPPLEPHAVHRIPLSHGHVLYAEECGNPEGLPVLFLHGGPGAGCKAHHRTFFNPQRYRAILPDQRGAGRSTPQGKLTANTTRHLLDDLEALRRRLAIDRWLLFGGSWGATLALLYAQQHPESVLGLILRGTFLARPGDLDWFLAQGAARIYPETWRHFLDSIPEEHRHDPIKHLYGLITGKDELAQRRAARAWLRWGGRVTLGNAFEPSPLDEHVSQEQLHKAQIELHYASHRYFLADNQVLDGCPAIAHLPAIIIHGRNDLVCPADAAFSLHRSLPGSELHILADAGHIAEGDSMINALVDAADRMAERFAP